MRVMPQPLRNVVKEKGIWGKLQVPSSNLQGSTKLQISKPGVEAEGGRKHLVMIEVSLDVGG
jgi:hypothetical protein